MICLRFMPFPPNSFLCQFITPESQRLFKKYSPIAKTAILPDKAMRPFSGKKNGRTEVQQDSMKKGSTVAVKQADPSRVKGHRNPVPSQESLSRLGGDDRQKCAALRR